MVFKVYDRIGYALVMEATSDILRNADDDRNTSPFDPSVRGRTDRFVLRFRKP